MLTQGVLNYWRHPCLSPQTSVLSWSGNCLVSLEEMMWRHLIWFLSECMCSQMLWTWHLQKSFVWSTPLICIDISWIHKPGICLVIQVVQSWVWIWACMRGCVWGKTLDRKGVPLGVPWSPSPLPLLNWPGECACWGLGMVMGGVGVSGKCKLWKGHFLSSCSLPILTNIHMLRSVYRRGWDGERRHKSLRGREGGTDREEKKEGVMSTAPVPEIQALAQ